MRLRPFTSRRYLALAVLAGFSSGLAAEQVGRTAVKSSHCELLDQLSPEQRQAHLDSSFIGNSDNIRSMAPEELAHTKRTLAIKKTIPRDLDLAISEAFYRDNPEWAARVTEMHRAVEPRAPQGDPRREHQSKPLWDLLSRVTQEIHRQCAPGVS